MFYALVHEKSARSEQCETTLQRPHITLFDKSLSSELV